MISHATAVADVDKGIVLARVDIAVPPERVFRALTTDELSQWWGQADMYQTTKHTMDLRPGGAWRSEGVSSSGDPFHVGGEVIEVEPPHRLVFSWKSSWEEGTTTVSYRLDATATGTRVTVRHSGFANPAACGDHAEGWERVFAWLETHLAPAAEDRVFLVRLLPPRPSFMMDMTPDERAAMEAHAVYWGEQLAAGTAIAFGPVADPKGGWGLGLVRAADEDGVAAFGAHDPALTSQIGLRYEVLPMLQLVR
jgi:uncharacterized protein YndB with AHSA1/START domain